MIITWKIEKLTRDLSDGFIKYALLSVTASKGGLSAMMNATCFFEKPNALVPYEGLSEAKVMSWCLERINLCIKKYKQELKDINEREEELYRNLCFLNGEKSKLEDDRGWCDL